MWITLPSTANMVNVQEIREKRELVTSKWKLSSFVSNSCEYCWFNVFGFCSIELLK